MSEEFPACSGSGEGRGDVRALFLSGGSISRQTPLSRFIPLFILRPPVPRQPKFLPAAVDPSYPRPIHPAVLCRAKSLSAASPLCLFSFNSFPGQSVFLSAAVDPSYPRSIHPLPPMFLSAPSQFPIIIPCQFIPRRILNL